MNKIHRFADVQSPYIGDNTNIWQFCVVLPQDRIGENCNICANVLIENEVVIGNNVTIKCFVEDPDGTTIEDSVFIGPNVALTNDTIPRSKRHPEKYEKIRIKRGASIGGNTTIKPGCVIGEYALIRAGSVVTKNIPANTVWYGNPASMRGYITNDGVLLDMNRKDKSGVIHNI